MLYCLNFFIWHNKISCTCINNLLFASTNNGGTTFIIIGRNFHAVFVQISHFAFEYVLAFAQWLTFPGTVFVALAFAVAAVFYYVTGLELIKKSEIYWIIWYFISFCDWMGMGDYSTIWRKRLGNFLKRLSFEIQNFFAFSRFFHKFERFSLRKHFD